MIDIIKEIKKQWTAFKVVRLCRKADKLHKKTNVQHFIIQINGYLRMINKKQFKDLHQRGIIKMRTVDELKAIAYYCSKKR